MTTVAAVIPARGQSALLAGCLEALRLQERQVDEILVVDDSDRGEIVAPDGVRVLRSGGRGPYAARNVGWRAAGTTLVLFLDVRSRPRPDWSARLSEAFDDPEVALAGSSVRILGGDSLAARVAEQHQFFTLSKYQESAFFRPYFPTCNLAARRDDLDAVHGFSELRSGGDADLCWRVLDRPDRNAVALPEVLMDWVPRDRLRGYLEQSYRYGRSHHSLRREWAARGAPERAPLSHALLGRRIAGVAVRAGLAALRGRQEHLTGQLRKGGRLAHEFGLRVAVDAERLMPARSASRALRSILFLDQGRASEKSALGHARVRTAIEAGADPDAAVELDFVSVPPSSRMARRATRPLHGLGRANLWSVRLALTRSWLARRLLVSYLRDHRPDVVHVTTDQVALLLGRLRRRVPFVLSLDALYIDWNRMTHGIPPASATPWYLRPNEWLEARALARASLVVAWTETVAHAVRAGAPDARVTTLHPGLDLDAFRPPDTRSAGGVPRVLFVGGRWESKGGPELVAALAPDLGRRVELDVVTSADVTERPGLHLYAASPGSAELHARFAAADVFCLPTTVDACPWVVLEAMAYGLPVVSTRVGSIPELIGEGGLVVPAGEPDALGAALAQLLGDPVRRERMGRAGRARVEEHYDARKNAPALIELLREVAAGQ